MGRPMEWSVDLWDLWKAHHGLNVNYCCSKTLPPSGTLILVLGGSEQGQFSWGHIPLCGSISLPIGLHWFPWQLLSILKILFHQLGESHRAACGIKGLETQSEAPGTVYRWSAAMLIGHGSVILFSKSNFVFGCFMKPSFMLWLYYFANTILVCIHLLGSTIQWTGSKTSGLFIR